jgi:hypothetical protein
MKNQGLLWPLFSFDSKLLLASAIYSWYDDIIMLIPKSTPRNPFGKGSKMPKAGSHTKTSKQSRAQEKQKMKKEQHAYRSGI